MSAALAAHVSERAQALCLAGSGATPAEVFGVFAEGELVQARMEALRHQLVLLPALASLGGPGALTPSEGTALALAALADVPVAPWSWIGSPPAGTVCATTADCGARLAICPKGPCGGFECLGGICRPTLLFDLPCSDGTPCTIDDRCQATGACSGDAISCEDDEDCTADTCHHDVGCLSIPIPEGEPCDDRNPCTDAESCDAEGICSGTLELCEDGDPCTEDVCELSGECSHAPSKAPCEDEDPCTQEDFCQGGLCRGVPIPCPDGETCTLDLCDPIDGRCTWKPMPEGLMCDDGDPCTTEDRCVAGLCAGPTTLCDDGLDCTLDACEAGTCTYLPAPRTCATDEGCIPVGSPSPGDPCSLCIATDQLGAAPGSEGQPCEDDGIPCTEDRCDEGVCVHADLPGTCHGPTGGCVTVGGSLGPCLLCAATGVAAPVGIGTPCDDGDACTLDDGCSDSGLCVGQPQACCPGGGDLECGEVLYGSTAGVGTLSLVDGWSCLGEVEMAGAERVHAFEVACSGMHELTFSGVPGSAALVAVDTDGSGLPLQTCGEGTCDTFTTLSTSFLLYEGQSLLVAVDQPPGLESSYTLALDCPCPESPP